MACLLQKALGEWRCRHRACPPGTIPDTWNLTHSGREEAVARAYVQAGSQVILTHTFRANAVAMQDTPEADLDLINRASVAISRRAAGQARVFASIGPTAKMVMAVRKHCTLRMN